MLKFKFLAALFCLLALVNQVNAQLILMASLSKKVPRLQSIRQVSDK